jgi:hypothetical protein
MQDQSAFEGMFSERPPENPEGVCDQNPIRLQGDTVEEVRAMMWSLYALWVSPRFAVSTIPLTTSCPGHTSCRKT